MKYRTGQLTTSQPIRPASRTLVATRHTPGRGPKPSEYNSSTRLPDIERLLDSTVQKIQDIHLIREHSQKSFDELWELVCARLAELGNAFAYARWRQNNTSLNLDKFQEQDAAVAKAWASGLTPIDADASDSPFTFDDRQFRRTKEERSALKLEIDISIDHVLEVAIAYWIEAMNAHKDGDELRAMHALIQCHFNLGIAHTLRMTHETKADDGRRAGLKERDALAKAVLDVMQNFVVTKSVHSKDLLLEGIIQALETDPAYEEVLRAYDAPAIGDERKMDPFDIRFHKTLKTWVTGRNPLYPDLALQFQNLVQQIKKMATTRNIVRRKANS